MHRLESALIGLFDGVNRVLVHLATLVSVWAADGIVAVLAAQNMINTLQFSRPVSILTGIALEGVGVVVSACALRVHRYNQSRAPGEPPALEWLAWTVMAVQFVIGGVLICVNVVWPDAMTFGLITLALLSTTGTVAHMLADDVAIREQKRQVPAQPVSIPAQPEQAAPALSIREQVLDLYRAQPRATQEQVAEAAGVSRQTVSRMLGTLAQEGAIRRNGHGVEVL